MPNYDAEQRNAKVEDIAVHMLDRLTQNCRPERLVYSSVSPIFDGVDWAFITDDHYLVMRLTSEQVKELVNSLQKPQANLPVS